MSTIIVRRAHPPEEPEPAQRPLGRQARESLAEIESALSLAIAATYQEESEASSPEGACYAAGRRAGLALARKMITTILEA